MKIGFLASRNGSGMRAVVHAIRARKIDARAAIVVSNRSEAGVLDFAKSEGVPTRVIPTLRDPETADYELCRSLSEAEVDLVLLSGYLRQLGPETLGVFEGRIINTHPALLPAYGGKGMYGRRVHEAVAGAGDTESGATIHLVDGEYDHGKIIAQRSVSLPRGASAETIEKIVMATEEQLLIDTVARIACGELLALHGA